MEEKMTSRLLLLGGIAIFLWNSSATGEEKGAKAPPTVVADTVKTVSEANPKRYVGVVEPIQHVDIMPRITGNLLKINFKEGEIIRKGTLLYELEDTTYRAAVDGLKAQKESLEAALKYAQKEFHRNNTLVRSKAVAVSAHDKSILDIDSAQANLKQVKASLMDAENTLSYTKIHAPITGRIGKSVFTEGNLITPTGGKLTDIEMIAPIYVRFSISERVFRRDFGGQDGIKRKAVVRIQLADNTIYKETAKVTLIDNKVSSSTNTITLWATFENKDHQLIPGSFVSVLVSAKADRKFCAIVPSALIMDNDGYQVYVLDKDNKATLRKVKTGGISNGKQIILEGLDGSERIIIEGTNKITPGMTVAPVSAEAVK